MYLWVTWQGSVQYYSIAPAPDWEEKANEENFDIRPYKRRIEKMCVALLGDNFLRLDRGGNTQELLLRVKVGTSKAEETRMVFADLTGWISVFLME